MWTLSNASSLCMGSIVCLVLTVVIEFPANVLTKSSEGAVPPQATVHYYIESEALLDFVEGLPAHVVNRLLKDEGLTRFISSYEDQVFEQVHVAMNATDYADLQRVLRRNLKEENVARLEALVFVNHTIVNVMRNSSDSEMHVGLDYPECDSTFTYHEGIDAGETVVEIQHEIHHPILRLYSRGKRGLHRILKSPNLLSGIRSHRNRLFNVLFLDLSLTSILKTEIVCYKFLSSQNVNIRTGLVFERRLTADQLDSIPTYLEHVSALIEDGTFNSTIVFTFRKENFTSPEIHLIGNRPPSCLFFDLLNACGRGGQCVGYTGISTCQCITGFQGKFCEKIVADYVDEEKRPAYERWYPWLYMLAGVFFTSFTGIIILHFKGVEDRSEENRKISVCDIPSLSHEDDEDVHFHAPKLRKTSTSSIPRPSNRPPINGLSRLNKY